MSENLKIDVVEELAKAFVDRCNATATQLERIASAIRTRGAQVHSVPVSGRPGRSASAGDLAAAIVKEITWGVANSSVDGICRAAVNFDRHLAAVAFSQGLDITENIEETVQDAVSGLTDNTSTALIALAHEQKRYGANGRVPTKNFAESSVAIALVNRGLAEHGLSPNAGYCLTYLGRLVVAEVKLRLAAKLADD